MSNPCEQPDVPMPCAPWRPRASGDDMDVDEAAVVDGTLASGRSAEEDGLLDCYPYTFSPLLLFAEASYFDKGYSNYNSVAAFFAGVLEVNMLENVLYERKNMLYEDLLHHVASQRMFVSCCIDAHFTAFQVLDERNLLYYDPLSAGLSLVSGESFNKLARARTPPLPPPPPPPPERRGPCRS